MCKLTTNFNIDSTDFDSSMLEIGEMMVLIRSDLYGGHVILKTYDRFISLNNPSTTWPNAAVLHGRKLLPGESITLTQE